MRTYRIAAKKYAHDLTGTGAALYPGRWNQKNTPVLYTAESSALALLELLVHIPSVFVPALELLAFDIPDQLIYTLPLNQLPKNWNAFPAPTKLSEIGQEWIEQDEFLALKVPSAILPESNNVILNCNHGQFNNELLVSRKKFAIDTRLLKRS